MHTDGSSQQQATAATRLLFVAPECYDLEILSTYQTYLDELVSDDTFRVTVLAPNASPLAKQASNGGFTLFPLSDFAKKLLERTHQLWPILTATRRYRFDVALCHAAFACRGVSLIANRVIGVCHDDRVAEFSKADRIVTLTSSVADLAEDLLEEAPPIDVLPLPYRCQFDTIKPFPEDGAMITIGTSGPFLDGDGLGVFIHMAQLLHQSHPDVRFVVAGSGPTEHELKELADSIAPFIDFVGPMNADELASEIDIFCLTPPEAPYPRSLCEMMDAGIACVSTSSSGPMDILKGGMVAPLVPINDAFLMADQLQQLLADIPQIERIKRSCFERIREEDFSEEQFGARLRQLLHST